MPQQDKPLISQPTQRAYTLRLRGADPQDTSWREALWLTHEAVNKGAKAFGDWLLTLRGGLSHRLAEAKIPQGKCKPDREPTDEERKSRRILLALSWLSVESKHGAPGNFIITTDREKTDTRTNKLIADLKEILKARGVEESEIKEWESACSASLSAAIREDAVWVNRSKAFDHLCNRLPGMNHSYANQMIQVFFGPLDEYLSLPATSNDEEADIDANASDGPEFRELARQWVSTNFGTGAKNDMDQITQALKKLASAELSGFTNEPKIKLLSHLVTLLGGTADDNPDKCLRTAVGWNTGRFSKGRLAVSKLPDTLTTEAIVALQTKLREEADEKSAKMDGRKVPAWMPQFQKYLEEAIGMRFFIKRDMTNEFSVMLDHAARRVSIGHSWIKRAEANRRKFDNDAQKIGSVPDAVKTWLDKFCSLRTETSGSVEHYRIRRRAIDGWKEVVAAWSRGTCRIREDRISAARELQEELEKFGDIQLFEALADDDARCVWHKNGDVANPPDPQPLTDYVFAHDAQFKQQHFKVPAYCHPDTLSHPVFCDFGDSRWDISFSVHKAWSKKAGAEKKAARKKELVAKAEQAVKASTGNQQKEAKEQDKLKKAQAELAKAQKRLAWLSNRHALSMGLWDGVQVSAGQPLFWSCKRLINNLALRQKADESAKAAVTRADRLGCAAAGATSGAPVSILGLFDKKHWNGRLQAPRSQLEAIARRVDKHGWDEKARYMRSRLRWLITFSAELQPAGPCQDYTITLPDKAPARFFVIPKGDQKGEWAVKHESNDARQELGKLILSRLPGLRVLSVDLGHRYAAACAVWEALENDAFEKECREAKAKDAKVVFGPDGCKPEEAIYAHFVWPQKESNAATRKAKKEGRIRKFKPVTIYRRIGKDTLPDGTLHPAPWARLDRQFLVRLQGEDKEAREASNKEIWEVHQLEAGLGRTVPLIDRLVKGGWGAARQKQKERMEELRGMGWSPISSSDTSSEPDEEYDGDVRMLTRSVDDLMSSAVRTLRLALKRHGDRARIAFAMTADYKPMPGDRKYHFAEESDASAGDNPEKRHDKYIEFILDALVLWHGLAFSPDRRDLGWQDVEAQRLWYDSIARLPGYQGLKKIDEDDSCTGRKKQEKEIRDRLRPAAEALAANEQLRRELHEKWKKRWEEDDGVPAEVDKEKGLKLKDATGWYARLRRIQNRLMPPKNQGVKAIRRVGGLSLTRLATLTEFRKRVQVGFLNRLRPDGSRGEPLPQPDNTETEIKGQEKFGQKTLDALDRLREQRVKQLASRIVEAALGIGRMKRPPKGKDPKRPRPGVDKFCHIDKPCHAIVIENLTNYRPRETRTRRENRQLMTWSASRVKRYLSEACQLNGLHLRPVSPKYTSHQDSRTGAPGIRCQDVPVKDFMQAPFWRKEVERAKKKQDEGKGDARDRFLCELAGKWGGRKNEWKNAGIVRIPHKGGEIFVSADPQSPDPQSPAAGGLQADLNAAANIGLRALTDPDWEGKWWYVPCDPATFKPAVEKVKGSAAISNLDKPLTDAPDALTKADSTNGGAMKKGGKSRPQSREITYLWRDVSSQPVSAEAGPWKVYKAYWDQVQARVVNILRIYAERTTNSGEAAVSEADEGARHG